MNTIPMSMKARSSALALRFFSLNRTAPHMNEIITELLLTRETTEIIESGWLSAVKYAKSAAEMNMDINGIAQLQWNGVVVLRFGSHSIRMTIPIMMNW